ncbi:hypothetical protein GWK41_02250 [Persephonella atlantica]|uniref:SCP2 domain-containing protein n=1 Tax=Persephonella atlantica TaxID=2699429 RepID=A0ABS1GG59_9AQUI|nr:hypothetical protein [Persephonella atlantica]MBK3331888.1 hypothetical protein [Persephonella atlantica]
MRVVNLVFNRIGNSFSALLDYPDFQIQIIDEVKFCIDNHCVEISGVSVDTNIPLTVELTINDRKTVVFFYKDRADINNHLKLVPLDEGFVIKDDRIIFTAGMDRELSGYLRRDSLIIPSENFFKVLSQIMIKTI